MKDLKSTINEKVAVLNFSETYCKTYRDILNSKIFKRLISMFLKKEETKKTELFTFISKPLKKYDLTEEIIRLFKLLTILDVQELKQQHPIFYELVTNKKIFLNFIERLYDFWRRLERYSIINGQKMQEALETQYFISANNNFADLVLDLYRTIETNIQRKPNVVYRQLRSGVNLGLVTTSAIYTLPNVYKELLNISLVQNVVLNPPFITYQKRNKRSGIFQETNKNPLENLSFDSGEWISLPLKVGDYFAMTYFHTNFMALGSALINLFEVCSLNEIKDRQPDLIYVFGYPKNNEHKEVSYFKDLKNNIYIGYSNANIDIDYFGYMKKMLLTLHNLKKLDKNELPIHGAMAQLQFKNGSKANVVIIGDSGAGKSETLEAFRMIAKDYITQMTTIFDDMGTLVIKGKKIIGYGTEVGAFVRVDDLSKGYPYEQIDRSIFMNPNEEVNARMVIPLTAYEDVMQGVNVDYVFQANNYEDKKGFRIIDNCSEAIKIFRDGLRMAKGTTSEVGVVSSFFSNPFGPVQEKAKTEKLLKKYFQFMFDNQIPVGELRTKLGIKGQETTGPQEAAKLLFEFLIKNKK
ncbi:phosphoenolpyruvate carboxykinase (ATP) [[Mycoplasma] testudinis]|uniref:hypothetical protein n=1 Tax=[Mycoplasma] testudinis TaxID=33924 RepID=UPI00047FB224|nr:hypothetical protein [[Mycoplasma] testudinis]